MAIHHDVPITPKIGVPPSTINKTFQVSQILPQQSGSGCKGGQRYVRHCDIISHGALHFLFLSPSAVPSGRFVFILFLKILQIRDRSDSLLIVCLWGMAVLCRRREKPRGLPLAQFILCEEDLMLFLKKCEFCRKGRKAIFHHITGILLDSP